MADPPLLFRAYVGHLASPCEPPAQPLDWDGYDFSSDIWMPCWRWRMISRVSASLCRSSGATGPFHPQRVQPLLYALDLLPHHLTQQDDASVGVASRSVLDRRRSLCLQAAASCAATRFQRNRAKGCVPWGGFLNGSR